MDCGELCRDVQKLSVSNFIIKTNKDVEDDLLVEDESVDVPDGDVLEAGQHVEDPGVEVDLPAVVQQYRGRVYWRNVAQHPEPGGYNDTFKN